MIDPPQVNQGPLCNYVGPTNPLPPLTTPRLTT
jgi:hypothetical protein